MKLAGILCDLLALTAGVAIGLILLTVTLALIYG
jgi:hypothetical protein